MVGVQPRECFQCHSALSRRSDLWLFFMAMATSALTTLVLAEDAYWYAIAGFLWLCLSLALAAARHRHHA